MPDKATTIRFDLLTKQDLDRLQAEMTRRRGRRVTHATVIAEALEFIWSRQGEFFRDRPWRPFTAEEKKALLQRGVRTGIRTSPEDIDRVLYGGDAP